MLNPPPQIGPNHPSDLELVIIIIPIYKQRMLNEILKTKLGKDCKRTFLSVQEKYDWVKRTPVETVNEYGERIVRPSTDDKLSKGTKKIIEKRTAIRGKSHLNRGH